MFEGTEIGEDKGESGEGQDQEGELRKAVGGY